ncbi:MAG: AMP-binding protein [Myxococcales bacterium]|nr:AMP-binding protein [Myxococcales bacterium]
MIEARGLWELVEERARRTPAARFAIDENGRELSFAEYRAAALRAAAGLAARGVESETVVSWMLPTWLESLVLVAALSRLGAVQNPILPIYREREVGFITRESGSRLLILPGPWRGFDYPKLAEAVADARPGLDSLVVDRDLPDADPADLAPPAVRPAGGDAPLRWIFYSSGTTADPKGARHSDDSLRAAALGMSRRLALAPDDRVALVFPFTHIGGIGWLFAGLAAGCSQILVEIFDARTSPVVLARHGVTQATAGTAFHQAYLEAQRATPERRLFPGIRSFPGGGAAKPPSLHHEVKRELGGAGIVSGYGLTECPIVTMNSVRDSDEKLANTEGRANATEIRIVRPDGSPAGPAQEGEICVRGPQLFRGYVDPTLDRDAFDEAGFFRTGDLGRLDAEGFLSVTGRLKDVIIRKGENISAREVEDLLYQHPKVTDTAVIGVPDPERGERCCAVVACRDPADPLEFDEMVAFLREQKLMTQKIPEQLEIVTELPRSSTGKVQKQQLRARYTESSGDGF